MLTETKAKNIKSVDKPLADGTVQGLRLLPSKKNGRGKWQLRFVSPITKKRRDMGLGIFPQISIAKARDIARRGREKIAMGLDPINEKNKAKRNSNKRVIHTFQDAAEAAYKDLSVAWKNEKHKAQWINTLKTYVYPRISNYQLKDLEAGDFAEVLRPIWLKKPETASRVKQRCSVIMKWCFARNFVLGNPVDVVDQLLPRQPSSSTRVQHFPSMPWEIIPKFLTKYIVTKASVSNELLEFIIHTGARFGEAANASWEEMDLINKVWNIPGPRMKSKVSHRVPLSVRVLLILKKRKAVGGRGLIFKSAKGNFPISNMTLGKILKSKNAVSDTKNRQATVHGFRASFRNWASENGYSRDLAERALAHVIKNVSEAAYHRTDLLDQRRPMMEAWSFHISTGQKNM